MFFRKRDGKKRETVSQRLLRIMNSSRDIRLQHQRGEISIEEAVDKLTRLRSGKEI